MHYILTSTHSKADNVNISSPEQALVNESMSDDPSDVEDSVMEQVRLTMKDKLNDATNEIATLMSTIADLKEQIANMEILCMGVILDADVQVKEVKKK